MVSHAKKKSQAANKKFEEMRRKNPPMLMSPEKTMQKLDTQESPEKTSESKLEPEGTGLLQKAGGLFQKINLFGGDKNKQNMTVSSNDDNSVAILPRVNEVKKPKKAVNFHTPLKN